MCMNYYVPTFTTPHTHTHASPLHTHTHTHTHAHTQLVKLCQELLMTVAVNTHQHSSEDLKVIEALISIRLKTKLFSTQFVACMK